MVEVNIRYSPAELQARLVAAATAGVHSAALVAEGIAKTNAPHKSGTLQGGIKAQSPTVSAGGVENIVETTTAQDYAVVQELGYWVNFMGRFGPKTMSGGKPRYMQRALMTTAPKLEEIVAAKIAAAF